MTFDILTVATICLGVSFLLSELFYRFKYPRVIGQILAGVVVGLPVFGVIFTPDILEDITFLSDLGIIFLLLLIGLQLNLEKFKKAEHDSIIIAIFCVLLPFTAGYTLMKVLGYETLVAMVVGAAFSLTAEGTKLKVLLDMKALNTRVGITMLGAGILDDLFEVLFLSMVIIFAKKVVTPEPSIEALTEVSLLIFKLILFVGIVYLVYKILPRMFRVVEKEHSRIATFSFIVLFGLIVAVISTNLGLGPVIGAFLAGIIIHLSEHHRYEHKENVRELEGLTFAFIVPFFFINIGLHLDFSALATNLWLILVVMAVAIASKLLGALLATPLTSLSYKQTYLIGWGMNSRGAIELVILELARANGLIPIEIYSAVVIMAVVTTLMFPVILKGAISKDRNILK